jgi:hypothetical protein
MSRRFPAMTAVIVTLGLALLGPEPARADGVTVALIPTTSSVAPGAEFDVTIQVTQAGASFNGFDAVVGWDPAALTFMPANPLSQQEGASMTGACGSTFHSFHQGASSDTIADVLLCNNTTLNGPAQLYRLHFKASSSVQATSVQFLPGLRFYDAGVYVLPIHATSAVIGIGEPAPTGVGAGGSLRLALGAAPNPSRGALSFSIACERSGPQQLVVRDVTGRVVRNLGGGWFSAGARIVAWDGRDDRGRTVAAGVYLATLAAGERTVCRRVTLLP